MPLANLSRGSLSFDRRGAGLSVLWIQGVGVCGSGWKPQVDELSRDFDCVTFDNRGLGASPLAGEVSIEQMAYDCLELMDSLGWSSAHLVGHSMGGVIAQQVALLAPRRTRSLSLLCTFSQGAEAARMNFRILLLGIRSRVGTRRMRRKAFLEMLFSPRMLAVKNADRLAAEMATLVGRDLADNPPIVMRQLKALASSDLSDQLSTLRTIPTLVASAEYDPIALPAYGKRLAELIPAARFAELDGLSHGAPIEDARRVNGLLRDHWNRC
jgi:pimeloyl-ACP methyl ester carboxylesterase